MTPELIRAAENLLSERDDWEDYWHYHAFRNDVKPLATAILANRSDYGPNGEELPVDEAFLRDLGGVEVTDPCDHPQCQWRLPVPGTRLTVQVWDFNGLHWVLNEMDRFPITTRPQLRRLLSALGIGGAA